MNQKRILALGVAALALSAAPAALAQDDVPREERWLDRRIPAPRKAVEVDFGIGAQTLSGPRYGALTNGGYSMEFGAGYRFNPRWMFGGTLQYAQHGSNIASNVRTVAPSITTTYHFMPYSRTDPWLQFGLGYRAIWENYQGAGADVMSDGFQILKVAVGMDLRLNSSTAVAPFFGVDVNTILTETPENGPARELGDPRVNTLLTLGVKGRFDLLGTREYAPVFAAGR
jgi:hypothetical protein